MKSKKITDAEIADLKVASLPTRPSAPTSFGGKGYTSTEVKEAFDKLPLYIIQKYNELISDILGENGSSVSDEIKTGIKANHTLATLFADITSGNFASYVVTSGGTLEENLLEMRDDINKIKTRLGMNL